jgi:hypothetical protein
MGFEPLSGSSLRQKVKKELLKIMTSEDMENRLR